MEKGIRQRTARNIAEGVHSPDARPTVRPALKVLSHYLHILESAKLNQLKGQSRIAFVLRASRVFLFLRAHIQLFRSDVYSNYAAPVLAYDLFRHLSRRHYLLRNLNLVQRVQYLLSHYRYEDASFDLDYKQRVYSNAGLLLWRKMIDGTEFLIRLSLSGRYAAEGELSVSLTVDGERLHSISFSWVKGQLAGGSGVAVFIASNQGRWRKDHEFHDKFNAAFPQNSPNFVCYAALQGLAQAVGANELRAVSGSLQVCHLPDDIRHFDNAYDSFWEALGGVAEPSCGYVLPVPQPMKPLSEVAAKHRKRAANRRALLNEISDCALRVVAAHFHGVPLRSS